MLNGRRNYLDPNWLFLSIKGNTMVGGKKEKKERKKRKGRERSRQRDSNARSSLGAKSENSSPREFYLRCIIFQLVIYWDSVIGAGPLSRLSSCVLATQRVLIFNLRRFLDDVPRDRPSWLPAALLRDYLRRGVVGRHFNFLVGVEFSRRRQV